MRRPQSLRSQLLSRLTIPLILVVMLDASASYWIALYYADQTYDNWLLDSAKSLAHQVKTQKNKVTFELHQSAVEVFRWDAIDKTFFKVESKTTGFIAGDKALPSPQLDTMVAGEPFFFDGIVQGKNVRIVSVLTAPTANDTDNVLISVAETLRKRNGMMHEILLAVLVPQLLLLLITVFHIWKGVNQGLRPLNDLAKLIAQRSATELSPIPDANVPMEVLYLTHTINALLKKLGLTLTTQQRFIENAAHQLRTPLAGLKIQAERALSAENLEAIKPALTHIKNSADRVTHLSTQLLTLARSESTSQGTQPFKRVDLVLLFKECCMDWALKALDRNIDLDFEAPDSPVCIQGNETLLRELLGNLLDNAICYSNLNGHISVKITVDSQITLQVQDDGPGIPPGETERIFDRFYRPPGSPGEGCGLGLAIVREIANLHAAQIRVGVGINGTGTGIDIIFRS